MAQNNEAGSQQNKKNDNPGFIKTPMSVTLNTREASKIWNGRQADPENNVHPIPGFPAYATMINKFWDDFLKGNLYARWWCMKLEQNIVNAQNHLKDIKKQLEDLTPEYINQVDIGKSESVKPISIPASFSCTYNYKVMYLIVEMDQLIAKLLGMRHTGIIQPNIAQTLLSDLTNTIREVLKQIRGYRQNDVTEEDIQSNNAKSIAAAKEMGEIPLASVLKFMPQTIAMPRTNWKYKEKLEQAKTKS